MFALPQNLMTCAQRSHIEGYTSVLGQRTRSQKSPFRVGLWPILSASEPDIAAGVGLVLAALLEQHSSVRVYRLLARVGENPENYEWDIGDSQFGVDDWEVEGLDENTAIWGVLEVSANQIRFSVEVENDAREDDLNLKLDYKTITLVELLNILPSVASKILNWLDPAISVVSEDQYEIIHDEDSALVQELLSQIFYWELDYFLEMWGQTIDQDSALADLNEIIKVSEKTKSNFGAWMIAQSMSRFMMFKELGWSHFLVAHVKEIVETLARHPIVAEILAVTLFRLNYSLEAFDLLESTLILHPKNSVIWNTLAALYTEAREDLAAIDVYQRTIEAEAATSDTYLGYANNINLLRERQIELNSGNKHISPAGRPFIDQYIFVDPNETFANLREATAAYKKVLEIDSENLYSLTQLVVCLLTLQDDSVWKYCQTLVERDKEGSVTASIIEQLSDSDVVFMIEILQKVLVNDPQQINVRINLVRAFVALGDISKAKAEIATISKYDVPLQLQPILSRLRLTANYPDFENRLGEIIDVLQARGKISATDAEFLEEIIEKEPSFSEGYRLLAETYLSWDETDDALAVLLDGQSNAPFDPERSALLAKVLWEEDQSDLAFAYLEKGLKEDSRNATLLSLNGRFLFDEGQDEAAKEFLLRAEEIDPSNPELAETRLYIANVLIETRKD